MKPFYDHAGVTIYHGDCREILPEIRGAGAIITDPPYGISYCHGGGGRGLHRRRNTAPIFGDEHEFDPTPFLGVPALFWGADHFARRVPPSGTWIAWDKSLGIGPADSFADCEFAWCSEKVKRNAIRYLWKGFACVKSGEDNGRRSHPTQKPLGVMRACLGFFPDAASVADPFMGSGTTAVACKRLGIRFIGVEIEERYCELAVSRLAQEHLEFAQEDAAR